MLALIPLTLLSVAAPAVDRAAPPPLAEVVPFQLPAPRAFSLKNGMNVWHVESQRAQIVDVIAVVDAGALLDPDGAWGAASSTAAMLNEGAGDKDAVAFAGAVADLGAAFGAGASYDSAHATLHVRAARFPEALALFASALMAPRFDDAAWARKKKEILGNFVVAAEEPRMLASLAGGRALFGASRHGSDDAGTPRDVMRMNTQNLRAFHAAHYGPKTVTLVVVGAIAQPALQAALEKAFGAWSSTATPTTAPASAAAMTTTTRDVVTVQVAGAPQSVVRFLAPAPAVTPFLADVEVMNTLLGGSFTSRLNNNLREEHGYSYGAGSSFSVSRNARYFGVFTSVATPVTVPALGEIESELERIHEAASADEANRARGYTALAFPSQLDGTGAVAGFWSGVYESGASPALAAGFMQRALQVDATAIAKAAQTHLQRDAMHVVVVGDVAAFAGDLKRFGTVRSLTAEELLPGLAEAQKLSAE